MKELTDLIEKIVTEKTFSLDAAKTVEELKQKFATVEKERDYAVKRVNEVDAAWQNEKSKRMDRDTEITALKTEVAAFRSQEEKAKAAIYEAEVHKAVAAAYKDAMQIVFKPNHVRETVSKSVPMAVAGQSYPMTGCENATIDREG